MINVDSLQLCVTKLISNCHHFRHSIAAEPFWKFHESEAMLPCVSALFWPLKGSSIEGLAIKSKRTPYHKEWVEVGCASKTCLQHQPFLQYLL